MKHLSRSIIRNETETVIKSLSTKNRSGLDGFIAKSYQAFKEEQNSPQTISFYEANITMIP
jgi:hypothetical protein